MMLKITLVLVCFLFSINLASTKLVSIEWNDKAGNFVFHDAKIKNSVAWASFKNEINNTGWAYLEVYTNGSYGDSMQAYAAGLAEGYVTKQLIDMHWHNTYKGYCSVPFSSFCQKLQKYLDTNFKWMQQQISRKANRSPYWHQVRLFLDQFAGLVDGYHDSAKPAPKYTVDITGLLLLQLDGDLEDLSSALQNGKRDKPLGSGSCSGLIKLLPGNADLYVSQDTWSPYSSMLRILKKYDFQFHKLPDSQKEIPGQVMTFSSYPGVLMSGDDFYVISTGLVTIETTIGNGNADLWSAVRPTGTVLEVIRTMITNRLAATGLDWVETFSQYNSGTYNNQWMVVDYNKFKSHKNLPDKDLLYVLEQLPGIIVYEDLTKLLEKQTYFPSYNTPYFPKIFNASGCVENVKKYGDWFTYEHTPRANIFRRNHTYVKDMESMLKLMRYNDFTHDPLSRCNCTPPYSGENGISARSDLNPKNGTYPFGALAHRGHGGTDSKITSAGLMRKLQFLSVSSPTYDDVPAFQWSKAEFGPTTPHIGHPDLWVFKPITHNWGNRT